MKTYLVCRADNEIAGPGSVIAKTSDKAIAEWKILVLNNGMKRIGIKPIYYLLTIQN